MTSKISEIIDKALITDREKALLTSFIREPVHAYLFTGKDEELLLDISKRFFAALTCPYGGCGTCQVCELCLKSSHPDFVVIYPEGQNILIEQARAIIRFASGRPIDGKYRFIVIAESHLMNSEAANALLKILEEPPASTIFVLLAESEERLPETIVSRTLRVRLLSRGKRRLQNEKVTDLLAKFIDVLVTHKGWQNLEKSIEEVLENEYQRVRRESDKKIQALKEIGVDQDYLKWIDRIEKAKAKRVQRRLGVDIVNSIINSLLESLNYALIYSGGISDLSSEPSEVYEVARDIAGHFKIETLLKMQEVLLEGSRFLSAGVSPEHVILGLILKIRKESRI